MIIKTYRAHLIGEDGMEFTVELEAVNFLRFEQALEEMYPEAQIVEMMTDEEYREREAQRYNRLADEIDSGLYND